MVTPTYALFIAEYVAGNVIVDVAPATALAEREFVSMSFTYALYT